MVFIGLRAVEVGTGNNWKASGVMHFNPHFIKVVNEKTMTLTLDDGKEYRIDDESLQIFLSAMYGEHEIRGDKLSENQQ